MSNLLGLDSCDRYYEGDSDLKIVIENSLRIALGVRTIAMFGDIHRAPLPETDITIAQPLSWGSTPAS